MAIAKLKKIFSRFTKRVGRFMDFFQKKTPKSKRRVQIAQLPMKTRRTPKMTLVLDLDETLVHSEMFPVNSPDYVLYIPFSQGSHNVYVKLRPFAKDLIQQLGKFYEIIVYTASLPSYAQKILRILDPAMLSIRGCICRDFCLEKENGRYFKDLRVLGRDMSKVVIIDNDVQKIIQQHNAISVPN